MAKRLLPLAALFILAISTSVVAQSQDQPLPPPPEQPVTEQQATAPASADQAATTNDESTANAADESTPSDEMPRTASELPLVALIGLSSGVAAIGVRRIR